MDISLDVRDISYFIDRISDIDVLCNVIESLGYHIGLCVVKDGYAPKTMFYGKRKQPILVISHKIGKTKMAWCVHFDKKC